VGRDKNPNRRRASVARDVLFTALGLVSLGLAFLLIPFMLGSHPVEIAFGKGLRFVAPYAFLAGFALLVLYAALRPRVEGSKSPKAEPNWFPNSTDFAPVLAREAAEDPTLPAARGQRAPALTWSPRVFEDIEWRRFEELCANLFGQAGFEAKTQSHGADGGVDIWLHSRHAEGPAALVQCKHWLGKPVGVKEVREFLGVMSSHKLQRGTFATSSTFTPDAQRFARENGISALDRQGLLALISRRTPEQQRQLLAVAYEGEYWRPTCASCGLKMAERVVRATKKSFWGCVNYPRCRFTLPARAAAPAAR